MIDEGYVKFQCYWKKTLPLAHSMVVEINQARQEMYELGGIGAYDNGIGFGNISQRVTDNKFVISGSATGNFRELTSLHYSLVTKYNIDTNEVWCEGASTASSESMSHAVIYGVCKEVNAVIHIHDLEMWNTIVNKAPTTNKNVSYGTPEMAREIIRLLKTTKVRNDQKYFAMAGHKEGIIAFGKSVQEAVEVVKCLVDCQL